MAKVKKIMKKNLFVAAAMMVAMTACVKEADVNVNVEENVPQTEEKVWVEFTAGVATKAELNGTVVTWEEDDLISINGVEFAIPDEDGAISADAKTAKFKAEVEASFLEAESFTAIYPASADCGSMGINVSATSNGVADIVAVATVNELGATLNFKHLTSFFKFRVPAEVSEVVISSDDVLAGLVQNVSFAESEGVTTVEYSASSAASNTITVKLDGNAKFQTGKDYYAAVLPGTKRNLTIRFDGYLSKAWTSDVNVKYGTIANMNVLPAPVKSSWSVMGSFDNWQNDFAMYNDVDGYSVIKGVDIKSTDQFKFRKDGKWDTQIAGGLTAPDTQREAGWVDITVSEAGTYDLYVDNKNNYYIMTPGNLPSAAGKPGDIQITVIYEGTDRDYLHMWSDGGEVANNMKQTSANTWVVTIPKGDQQKRDYMVILKKGSGWGNQQTADSDKMCLRNPMPLKVVNNKATHK